MTSRIADLVDRASLRPGLFADSPGAASSYVPCMRVAVLADCHIDHGHHELDAITAWTDACRWIAEERVDIAIIAGDMFQDGKTSGETLNIAGDGLEEITKAGVPVLIVLGNHEWYKSPMPRTAADRFLPVHFLGRLPRVKVVTDPQIVTVPNTDLRIAALPWPRPGDPDDVQAEAAQRMSDQLNDHNGPRICVAHAAVSGAKTVTKTGSERDLWTFTKEPVVPVGALDIPEAFGHTALGHIHRRQNLTPTCSYVGSNEAFTFADENQTKGFSLFEWDDRRRRWDETQIPVGVHRFVTVTIGDDMPDDLENTHVRLHVPAGLGVDDVTEARELIRLNGGNWMHDVHEDDVPDDVEMLSGENLAHEGMSVFELLDILWERDNTPKKERPHLNALAGELFHAA